MYSPQYLKISDIELRLSDQASQYAFNLTSAEVVLQNVLVSSFASGFGTTQMLTGFPFDGLSNVTIDNMTIALDPTVQMQQLLAFTGTNITITNTNLADANFSLAAVHIEVGPSSVVLLQNCTFSRLTSPILSAGLNLRAESAQVTLDGVTFSECYANQSSGAFFQVIGTNLTIVNSVFDKCQANNGTVGLYNISNGGAVMLSVSDNATVLVKDTVFSNNLSAWKGGALYGSIVGSAITWINVTVAKNTGLLDDG